MREKLVLIAGMVGLLFLSGCTTGRYQTVVTDRIAIMTDTATGQAWGTLLDGTHGGFENKDFSQPKLH